MTINGKKDGKPIQDFTVLITLPWNLKLVSVSLQSLVKWIEDGVPEDPFLNPELMKNNPWVEKGKCILL